MMNINKKLEELLTNDSHENEVLEFKEAKNQFDFNKLGKYFSALSNEANLLHKKEAWIIFGIQDNKKIVGTNFRKNESKLQNLKKEIADQTTNRITFKNIYATEKEGKRIVLFQIPSAPKGIPIAWQGHYYGRDGEHLHPLNLEEIERIRKQNSIYDWSSQICKDATLDDISKEAITKAKQLYIQKNPKLKNEIKSWDNITFLNKAKICIKNKITNTAIILLGKPESEHLISPAIAKISWILRDKDNIDKDYEHFSCPFLLNIEKVYNKIRNLKYRYLQKGSLFPDEVDQYDPYIIREALNNCIAHQDYEMNGKINIIEKEDGILTFKNLGSFIPKSIENVVMSNAPESKYRNAFLADAMVKLNMIDTIGSGIKRMFMIQKEKLFPLPEYNLKNNAVIVSISGKVIDLAYAEKLVQMPTLSLDKIILLDKVQKNKTLNNAEIKLLKNEKLIEGRKPKFHISSVVASETGQKSEYIKMRGIDNDYIQKVILDYLKKFGQGRKTDFDTILLNKLSSVLDIKQKKDKVRNSLQSLRRQGIIDIDGKIWQMSK